MKPRVTGNIRRVPSQPVLGWRPHHAQGGKDPHFKGVSLWREAWAWREAGSFSRLAPWTGSPSPSPALLFPKPPRLFFFFFVH